MSIHQTLELSLWVIIYDVLFIISLLLGSLCISISNGSVHLSLHLSGLKSSIFNTNLINIFGLKINIINSILSLVWHLILWWPVSDVFNWCRSFWENCYTSWKDCLWVFVGEITNAPFIWSLVLKVWTKLVLKSLSNWGSFFSSFHCFIFNLKINIINCIFSHVRHLILGWPVADVLNWCRCFRENSYTSWEDSFWILVGKISNSPFIRSFVFKVWTKLLWYFRSYLLFHL